MNGPTLVVSIVLSTVSSFFFSRWFSRRRCVERWLTRRERR